MQKHAGSGGEAEDCAQQSVCWDACRRGACGDAHPSTNTCPTTVCTGEDQGPFTLPLFDYMHIWHANIHADAQTDTCMHTHSNTMTGTHTCYHTHSLSKFNANWSISANRGNPVNLCSLCKIVVITLHLYIYIYTTYAAQFSKEPL